MRIIRGWRTRGQRPRVWSGYTSEPLASDLPLNEPSDAALLALEASDGRTSQLTAVDTVHVARAALNVRRRRRQQLGGPKRAQR